MRMIHWRIDKLLYRYLNNQLGYIERVELEKHLQSCPGCRRKLELEQQLDIIVPRLQSRIISSETFRVKLLEAIKAYPVLKPSLETNRPTHYLPSLRYSMAILLLIGFLGLMTYLFFPKTVSQLDIQGNGLLVQHAGNMQWINVCSLKDIRPGDTLKTDEFSMASLTLGTNAHVWIGRSSELAIGEDAKHTLMLNRGSVYFSVKHHPRGYMVETPNGTVEVMGTEFQIKRTSQDKILVTCVENTVIFKNEYGTSIVPAGYQTEVQENKAPAIASAGDVYSATYLKKLMEWKESLTDVQVNNLYVQLLNVGKKAYNDKDYNKALWAFQITVQLKPNEFQGYYEIGRTCLSLEEYSMGKSALTCGLRLRPTSGETYYYLGRYAYYLGDLSTGIKYTEQHLSKMKTENGYIQLGDINLAMNRYKDAEAAYNESQKYLTEKNPVTYGELHSGLAVIQVIQGNSNAAHQEILKTLNNHYFNDNIHFKLAWAYQKMGDINAEKYHWNAFLALQHTGYFTEYAHNRLKELQ